MNLTEELLASGLPTSIHNRLNYRVVTADEALNLTGHKHAGWVVPMNGPDGKPYQWEKGKDFYRLKPAIAVTDKDGNKSKYLTASNAGCRPYLSPLLPEKAFDSGKPIDWTEGEKKADCANYNGFATIGLSGVDSWRDRRNGISQPLPEFEALNLQKRTHRIAFDSDIVQKPEVLRAMAAFSVHLAEKHLGKVLITFIPPEIDGTKNGVDDFIVRHGANAYNTLRNLARAATEINPEGKHQFNWQIEPKESHDKSFIAWTVFKDNYARRKGVGIYQWNGSHWQLCIGRSDADALLTPLHLWMDHCGWVKRSTGMISSVVNELLARLQSESIWDVKELIAFRNGTLNWKTGIFTAGHRREDYLTFCLPYDFNPKATCPNFHQFINEACGKNQDLINIVRAGFRWSIAPKNINEPFPIERSFDVSGRKGHGKGTLSETLQALVGGDHGRGLIKSTSFTNANSLAALIGKKVAIDPDSDGRISSAGTFNMIVTNEPVEVKILYKDSRPQRLGVVIWRFFNDSPGASGASVEGMGRRIITLPFDIEPSKRDPLLKQKIIAEAAGIFAWVYAMPTDEMELTLENSGSVESSAAASIEHCLERDPLMRFLIETYPLGNDGIKGADLFESWCSWCSKERHESGSNTRFGTLLKKVVVGDTGITKRVLHGRKFYAITPMDDFPVGAYFGVVTVTPTQKANPLPNPLPGKSLAIKAFKGMGDRGDTSLLNLNLLKKRRNNRNRALIKHIEAVLHPKPSPLSPQHPADAFTDAAWALDSNTFVPSPKEIPAYISGSNGGVLLGKIPGNDPSIDLMVIRTPSGKTVGCRRSDFSLKE